MIEHAANMVPFGVPKWSQHGIKIGTTIVKDLDVVFGRNFGRILLVCGKDNGAKSAPK